MILSDPELPWKAKVVANRIELLKLVPKNSEVAEIGVLAGDYSSEILKAIQPSRLWLIDWWQSPYPFILNFENPDGTFRQVQYNSEECYPKVIEKFKENPKVLVLRGTSYHVMSCLSPHSLDMVYLDADHSYQGCTLDLEAALPKIKSGGWIMGHDYCSILPGVVQAVNEFCIRKNLKIDVITSEKPSPINHTEDFCSFNSYAIRIQ